MRPSCFFVLLLILSTNTESLALDRISLGIGKSKDSISIYRLGFQEQFGRIWFESKRGHLSGYHEASLSCWEHERESIQQAAYSPVFSYSFAGLSSRILPYLEAGIGIGYLSKKTINGRDLSTRFQFEDRIGIGVKIGKEKRHDLSFRYMHYSNASIKQPNDGIDIFIFSYTFSL
ncbi:MAG: acyloxyacyl hydrolase [candidate division Zixibacteria bacterium]|nr:acyloxyacyl hydrolase [candidate division Zixibacteria bacterium]